MTHKFNLLFGALLLVQLAAAQTPGEIFRTAVNDSLLDPNGDGWISATTSGFSDVPTIQDESEEFETSWNVLWHYELEPSSDLQTGSTCGPTEIVDNPNTNEHAAYWKIHDPDGVAGNEDELLLFRMRINSDPNNAAYGYSFLIDSDQKFGSSGPDADPNALSGNPGFEYEILFASGNSGGVFVNDVDGVAAHNAVTTLQSYADGVNDQRSYARFSNCSGATPIFIDFFIAFADLGPSVTSNTVLRMLFASASSANSALNGSASDIGGVNDSNYPDDDSIFDTYITAVPTIQFSVGYSIVDVDGDGVDDASDNCTDLTACNYDGSVNNVACTFATTWYADTDADGYGDSTDSQSACSQPAGYVSNSTDCDDTDNTINALDACGVCGGTGPSTWYADADGDGYGDSTDSQSACTQPAGYVATSGDCDDTDNSINPGAAEVCDGSDNDCDTSVDEGVLTTFYRDADGDGYGDSGDTQQACSAPAGYVSNSTDCDDTDNSINALDACGVCGGPGPSTWYADADGDGLGDSSDSQSACAQPAGYVANSSDLCDDNTACNYDANSVANAACAYATTWYADTDSDGFGDASSSQSACTQPAGYVSNSTDCDDTDNSINALDACGVCGGTGPSTWYADADGDGFGDSTDSQSACTQPAGYVSNSTDCDDTDNTINALDACGVCGGTGPSTWYADADSDGLGDSSDSQSACAQPAGYVADSSDNCDDLTATNYDDAGNAPCSFGIAYTGLDSLLGCENQANVTMDLDTMHAGTGSWTYSIDTNIDGFASSSVNSNLIEIDFSANGLGRDTVEVSGTDGTNTVSISLIVQESTYPYWTSIDSDGASVGNADGGAVYTFEGHGNQAVTVHYFKDAIMIFDGGINKFAGYGTEYTLETDANGNWTNQLTDAVWVSGYTSAYGCYSPEPATSGTPTSSPKIRQVTVPHLVD